MRISGFILIASFATAMVCRCSKELCGPCYQAMLYRKDADKASGNEKAALQGRADAAQRECDVYNQQMIERQKRTMQRK